MDDHTPRDPWALAAATFAGVLAGCSASMLIFFCRQPAGVQTCVLQTVYYVVLYLGFRLTQQQPQVHSVGVCALEGGIVLCGLCVAYVLLVLRLFPCCTSSLLDFVDTANLAGSSVAFLCAAFVFWCGSWLVSRTCSVSLAFVFLSCSCCGLLWG